MHPVGAADPKWSPGRPKGGQGATLSPTLVDFEGSENRSIFEAPSGRQKIDGCSPWGGSGGQHFPRGFGNGSAGARQVLGGGVRFEKGVPRAALVRARLINKLIKFREFIIFRIFKRIKGVRSDTPWAGGLANLTIYTQCLRCIRATQCVVPSRAEFSHALLGKPWDW